ncbi:MAG: hypothetical protein HOC56_16985 [Anaerolineae bacterium]|nr:hypothetical protein [Anaerolineae bacterium]MBT6062142.1 hypothetical protein [Anaerolineae bacterium]MBT7190606.1 hypothetical protein [Anaerolineae bacterium]
MDIQQAWQTVLGQLQMEMPRAAFDTWVRDTQALTFEDGVLTIGVRNAYARDWLESRLTSTVSRLLIGIMNQTVDVSFLVSQSDVHEDEPEEIDPKEVSISPEEAASLYDRVVRPERAVYLPGYFRKHLAQLGPDLGWMYIGFRQAAYGEGARTGSKTARFSGKQIAALCGITERTFWNRVERAQTWERFAGLVSPIYSEPEWMDGPLPRRLPRKYTVAMTLPLTAADAHALTHWLQEQVEIYDGPLGTLAASIETPLQELLSAEPTSSIRGVPQDVLAILRQLFAGDLPDGQLLAFAERLRMHIMPQSDQIVVSLFFLEHILPYLGVGPAWMYILLRDRCFEGLDEQRDLCTVQGGYSEIASWLGIARPLTVYEWFYGRFGSKAKESGKLRYPVTCAYLTAVGEGRSTSFAEGARTFQVLLNDVPPEIVQAAIESDEETYADFSIVFTRFSEDRYATFSILFTRFAEDLYAIFRVFKALNSLKNSNLLEGNPPSAKIRRKKKTGSRGKKAGVGSLVYWDLGFLFANNAVSPKKQAELRKKGGSGETFAAWLLYAKSAAGAGLQDKTGISNAIARTLESPRGGPGGVASGLALLPPHRLKAMLERDLEGEETDNPDYQAAFETLPASDKKALLKQLFGD